MCCLQLRLIGEVPMAAQCVTRPLITECFGPARQSQQGSSHVRHIDNSRQPA